MHRRSSPEFQLQPEIERVFRALRRRDPAGFIALGRAAAMATPPPSNHGSQQQTPPRSDDGSQQTVPQVQPRYVQEVLNQTVIGMANDRDRPMRDYVVFDPQTMETSIVRPELATAHFEFKPMMFQMLQTIGQFGGMPTEDPHLHLKQFVEVCSNFILLMHSNLICFLIP